MWRSLQQPRIRKGGNRTQSTLRFETEDSKSLPKIPFLRLPFGSLSHIHSNNEVPGTTVRVWLLEEQDASTHPTTTGISLIPKTTVKTKPVWINRPSICWLCIRHCFPRSPNLFLPTNRCGWMVHQHEAEPEAHRHPSHASRSGYLPPALTAHHFREHSASIQMFLTRLSWTVLPGRWFDHRNKYQQVLWGQLGGKLTGHSLPKHETQTHIHHQPQHVHSLIVLHVFPAACQGAAGKKERGEAGEWECNWNSGHLHALSLSGLVSLLVPEDGLSDQQSQASGWQDITLWQKDVSVERPCTAGEMDCLSGFKIKKPQKIWTHTWNC